MNSVTFTQEDFAIFAIEGLEPRMKAIRKTIQPKFKELGKVFSKELAELLNEEELPVHIAQHIRRTKNPPKDTWCAIGGDTRGYKKYPHFQLGLYQTHLFIWLAFIDNPQHEKEMAQDFLKNSISLEKLPADYVVSFDHTKEQVMPIKEAELEKGLMRWRDIKKGEFLVGRQLSANDPMLVNPQKTQDFIFKTYAELLPLYQQAFRAYP
ncbi:MULTISPECIES: DUF1054 family protein [Carnobacterium]|uniref:UPF0637 protein ACFSBK_07070 n=1 Tax=Carnobacterium antarcticum TaxID=2126436 RepID=A0ABW4NMY8_9LACT|nr:MULTISPECIES: DUF1054 family protein [unclassified Carnobacterium]ALV20811.1 hypothetical protein NY10_188 [Carnobacterium sp. CP1]QQP70972.1 DUF1054 domain-containing protein [Carnobacterium sp. CS13]